MENSIAHLIGEVLGGTTRAIIAILLIIIIVLIQEIRTQRANVKEAYEKLEKERQESLKLIDTMQTRFTEKSEQMVEKYHEALNSQHINNEKLRDTINNVMDFVSRNKQ